MFKPPFCPRADCSQHREANPNFYLRHGSYSPQCRAHPVPRFRCRSCGRTFSRQTFRADYYDRRPDLNAPILDLVTMGVGIRMCSRRLGLSLRCTELKLRKIGRHLRHLNLNLQRSIHRDVALQFDEFESFEGRRNTRPLTIPVLLESRTRFCIWAEAATIRPKGRMTEKRLQAITNEEKRYGPRKDRSRQSVMRTLRMGRRVISKDAHVTLYTDKKSSYPTLANSAFGVKNLTHHTTSGKLPRTAANPLFPINHEEARLRDMNGRMRRRSWLASKKRRYLNLALHVHMAYRNLIRTRFNFDRESPAQLLGFLPRPLTLREALSWRQCWRKRSLHPLGHGLRSVESFEELTKIAG
jgi:transposase-like protein